MSADVKAIKAQIERAVKVGTIIEVCQNTLMPHLPPGRAKAMVQTKLDEARLWAIEAVQIEIGVDGVGKGEL